MKPYTPKMTEETFFLSSDKRSELIDKLVGYCMPLRFSIYEAVIVDDPAVVNFRMAETARNCIFRASQISEIGIFGDPNDLNQLATFLRCDVTVLEAYRAEAAARNLGGAGLLTWFTFELPKVALQ
jgi:hypothetical protein